ncbi:hypothetical protein [Streptomyces macrosporus]|uniref:Uncharacterized protein n=1 Tax=Streptomyces macrosporus TaxID=44032 RepID=A0ABP5XSY8_9ACTN
MTEKTTTPPAPDRWDRRYGSDEQPTTEPEPTPGAAGRIVHVAGRSGRLPDWWAGPVPLSTLDADKPTSEPLDEEEPPTQEEEPAAGEGSEEGPRGRWRARLRKATDTPDTGADQPEYEGENTDDTADTSDAEEKDDGGVPPWDPVAIAGRLVHAHQHRPVHTRLHDRIQDLAQRAAQPKPRLGQAIFTLSGVWACWHYGLTPWLIQTTAGAPIGVSLGLVAVGWSIHRQTDGTALPVAWCGHAVYTTTVLAAALHP